MSVNENYIPSEYEYLEGYIIDRYEGNIMREIYPLMEQVRSLWEAGSLRKAITLEHKIPSLQQQLMDKRLRSEDIVRWLRIDSELRQEHGWTLPDLFERPEETELVREDF